jgi:hypothetical protein
MSIKTTIFNLLYDIHTFHGTVYTIETNSYLRKFNFCVPFSFWLSTYNLIISRSYRSSYRGESNEESTMNAIRKVRFWLKQIVCAINKQNSTGILCRTQTLINKKNFSRQSNNKFRDRPHMII